MTAATGQTAVVGLHSRHPRKGGAVIPGLIHLDLGCNVVHLVLGLWGIWAGYLTAEARQAVASA